MNFLCAEDSVMLEKLHKKVRVIKEISLPINLHDFFATFVDDGAPHSYQRYVRFDMSCGQRAWRLICPGLLCRRVA